jgi:hypothetical protein
MTSGKFSVSAQELETFWSFEGLMSAHQVLNALEDAEARARREAQKK